jgi:hypothetical protein
MVVNKEKEECFYNVKERCGGEEELSDYEEKGERWS